MSRMMHLFRKYQYLLLVFFGVLLIIVFVVGDALQSFMQNQGRGGGGPEADPVVLTWRQGQVTSSDLYSMRVKHNILMEFLNEVVQETTRREGSPKGFGVVPARDDQDLVRKILLAAKAESMGLVVDNDAAQAFLRQLSDNLLEGPDFKAIYDKAVRGRITQQHLMDQLKRELTADQLMMMSRAGLFVMPPHEAWELHNRLHRRVQTELALLKADDFKAKVTGQPSEAQITALYEQGKDEYPYPTSPEPAFKRRRKVNFAFAKADLNKFADEEAAKIAPTITDAEIEEHYNKNKERYRVLDLPQIPGATEQPPADPTAPAPASDNATPPAAPESKPAEGKESDKKEQAPASTEEKPAAEEKPAPAENATPEDKPQEKAEEKPPEQPAPEEQPNPGAQGSLEESTQLTLVAFQESQPASTDPAAQPAVPAEAPAAPEKAENAAPEKADNAAPAPAQPAPETTPAAETPATNPENPAEATAAAPSAAETPPVAPAGTAPAEKQEEPKYKPLDDKLRGEIREEISRERAQRAAQVKADKGLEAVRTVIEQHGRKLRTMEIAEETPPSAVPPEYEQLAIENGLAAGETGLVDELGIQDFELGQTTEFSMGGPAGFEQVPFSRFGFDPALQPYRPQRIRDFVARLDFVYWIVDTKAEYAPELKDIRDEVIDKWKQQEAFLMAKAEGDKLSKELAGDKPLSESLTSRPEFTISQPPPFSWMSTGFTPFGSSNAPALSNVAEVEGINDEFMRSIFALRPGEVGVAVNQPQTAVYIVRIVSESPSEEVLREQFLASGVTNEIQHMALVQTNDLWLGWYADVERELQVEWKN